MAMTIKEYFDRKRASDVRADARDAAAKAEDVKVALQTTNATTANKLNEIAIVGRKTEALCNSAMGAQKRLLAVTARAKATISNDPVDISAAEQAEKELAEHVAKQADADTRGGG